MPLCAGSQVINWHIGDWWNRGVRNYGEAATVAQAAMIFGKDYDTVRACGWLSEKFESVRRRTNLSWAHHREVGGRPPIEADALLDRAEADNLSTRDLRREVIAIRLQEAETRRRPRDVIDIRPAPAEPVDIEGVSMSEMGSSVAVSA